MHCAPPSFWPAPQLDYRLPSNLIATIDQTLATRLPRGISKLERHNILQQRLHTLGADLDFTSRIEVSTGYRRFEVTGRFDAVWTPHETDARPIIFEIDSCWRHESLLKLGRVGEEALKLWIYYGQRPFPLEPTEPGFRRLNILRLEPWRLGIKQGRQVRASAPGLWPEPLYPQRGGRDVVERLPSSPRSR